MRSLYDLEIGLLFFSFILANFLNHKIQYLTFLRFKTSPRSKFLVETLPYKFLERSMHCINTATVFANQKF